MSLLSFLLSLLLDSFCPSVFILEPGQLVHINKNRYHAFRKLSGNSLSENDCHCKLRKELLNRIGASTLDHLCVSIAWDWMFKGATVNGIMNELLLSIEAGAFHRKHVLKNSLAQPHHALLSAASSPLPCVSTVLLKGLLLPLEYFVKEDCNALLKILDHDNVRIRRRVLDGEEGGMMTPFSSDFLCKVCSAELANGYLACWDCLKRYDKDTYICYDCFLDHTWKHRSPNGKVKLLDPDDVKPADRTVHNEVMLCCRMGTVVEEVKWLVRVAKNLRQRDVQFIVDGKASKIKERLGAIDRQTK